MKAILLCGTLFVTMLTATVANAQTLHPAPKHPVHHIDHHTMIMRHEMARRAAVKQHEKYVHNERHMPYNGHVGTIKRHDGYTRDIY